MSMKIANASRKKIEGVLKKMFRQNYSWQKRGDFCFVHLDKVSDEEKERRVCEFKADRFFDPRCPHCKPFLTDGAFMVFDGPEVFGLRIMADGLFETVFPVPRQAAASN